jgi:hypothetical protein
MGTTFSLAAVNAIRLASEESMCLFILNIGDVNPENSCKIKEKYVYCVFVMACKLVDCSTMDTNGDILPNLLVKNGKNVYGRVGHTLIVGCDFC